MLGFVIVASSLVRHPGSTGRTFVPAVLVERVWLYLRERYLSHRLLADYEAVVDACCTAWNKLTAEAGRLRSLTAYPTSNRGVDGVV
jgi:hypothetical protein